MSLRLLLFLIAAVFFFDTTANAQPFTKVIPQNPVGTFYSDCRWFDFDNDDDLDFIITGEIAANELKSQIYENKGNNIFSPALSSPLPNYSEGKVTFANLNYDDRIDIILMGRIIGVIPNRTSMLHNTTNGFVTNNNMINFVNRDGYGLISWGDVNQDAKCDLFVSNVRDYTSSAPIIKSSVFVNAGNEFTESTSSDFLDLFIGESNLADIDNDKDLDLIIAGSDNDFPAYQQTEVYLNDGSGNFSLDTRQSLTKLQNASIAVADYDNDRDLDLAMTGFNESLQPTTKLYSNNGGVFTAVPNTGLVGYVGGSIQWGDFDNDSDLDLLIAGSDSNDPNNFSVFKNLGNSTFVDVQDAALQNVISGHAAWGDCDNDGDLDILVSGVSGNNSSMYILRNDIVKQNTRPTAPQDLSLVKDSPSSIKLMWDQSTDIESPQKSLTYNIEIKRDCDEYQIHSFSNESGWRRIVEAGNVGLNTQWDFKNLDNGRYRIRVQAIDGGYIASAFSNEQVAYIGAPIAPTQLTICQENGTIKLGWIDDPINEETFIIERSFENGPFLPLDAVSFCVEEYLDTNHQSGLYEYRVKAANPNGESPYSNIVSIQATNDPVLSVDLGSDAVLCDEKYELQANAGFGSYHWSTGETTRAITVSSTGTFWVTATSSGCNIEMGDTISLTFENIPTVNFGENRTLCEEGGIVLRARKGFDSYLWQDNSTDSILLVSTEGKYWVSVANGCGVASDTINIIEPINKSMVVIPNVFTPNNDAHNELFIIDEALLGSNLIIYNRWGKKLREFNNYDNTWNGDDLPAEVYYFSIRSEDACHKELNFKGWLSIIR